MPVQLTCSTCNETISKVSKTSLPINGGGSATAFFCKDCNALLSLSLDSQSAPAAETAPDTLSQKIDALTAQHRQRRQEHFQSAAVATVQRIISTVLGVPMAEIKREHIARYLRQMPDAELLRYRGLGPVTLAKARREVASD